MRRRPAGLLDFWIASLAGEPDQSQHQMWKERHMPTYTMLEISWDQLEWTDVLKLLQTAGRWSSIDVRRSGTHIFASVHALRFASSRETWLSEAKRLEFSSSLVSLAEWAAGKDVSMICAVQGRKIDPKVPFQRVPAMGTSVGISPGCRPLRFVICERAHGGLPYPDDEDKVRWIAGWQRMEILVVQVLPSGDDEWFDGRERHWWKVEEEKDSYLADPEAWDLVVSDELPDWGRRALSESSRQQAERYL
jgi:hypothetical protein